MTVAFRLFRAFCAFVIMITFVASACAAESAADSKKFYEAAVRAQPKNPNAHYDLGNVYFMEGRYEDALANYLKAGSLGLAAARMSNYHFNVSVCYFKLGKTEEAIRSAEACLVVDPQNNDAKDLLALYKDRVK